MSLLTVFANFRIDSEERFLRMQDSFRSFCHADIEKWVVNIRGPFRKEAAAFLTTNLGQRLDLFQLESKKGWFHDSQQMLPAINSDYVLFWVEDHICVSGVIYLNRVVAEMKRFEADYLLYSAFHDGDSVKSFQSLTPVRGDGILVLNYDVTSHNLRMNSIRRNKLICATFIISCPSILKRSLFRKILLRDDPLIKRWPKAVPFDFEKSPKDTHWLPLKIAQLEKECFAFIDDDHGRPHHSLISRGLYPNRVSRETMLALRESQLKRRTSLLPKRFVSCYREIINKSYSKTIGPFLLRGQ